MFHLRGGGGGDLYGEKEKVVFPAHPCLTNSRGDNSIQGVINVSSNYRYLFIHNVCLQGHFSHAIPPVHVHGHPHPWMFGEEKQ